MALVPLFAATSGGLGAAWAGFALTIFAVGNALALQVSGRLVDAHGRRRLVILGLIVSAVGTVSFGMAHSPVPFLLLSLLAGAGAGIVNPAQQAAVAGVVRQGRSGARCSRRSRWPPTAGRSSVRCSLRVADAVGFPVAFAVTAAVLLVGALAWVPARETMPTLQAVAEEPGRPG